MGKPVSVNPLKIAPGLGAAVAAQGIKGAMPVFHAGPGCTFLSKVVLTGHMREPIALLGTDIKEMTTILGGWDLIEEKVKSTLEKNKPELLVVIATALAEVRGEDTSGVVNHLRNEGMNNVMHVSAPDFHGAFAEGYAKFVEELFRSYTVASDAKDEKQINILPAPYMTSADIEEIGRIVEGFGLKPVFFPDLSTSVDGSKDKFSAVSLDGTTLEEVKTASRAVATFSFARVMDVPAHFLETEFQVPAVTLSGLTGIQATDEFITHLMNLSSVEVPRFIKRERARLSDGMVDVHGHLFGKRVALGLEADHLLSVKSFLGELGIQTAVARVPFRAGFLKKDPTSEILSGDLEDIENDIFKANQKDQNIDLLFTNSHGSELSKRNGIPLYRIGFPIYDRFGEMLKCRTGYRGTASFLFEIANTIMDHNHDHGFQTAQQMESDLHTQIETIHTNSQLQDRYERRLEKLMAGNH